tara:strand:+ start:48511 stop:49110 length:600 start_codon:yes stop_codon:yes gene_type:complete
LKNIILLLGLLFLTSCSLAPFNATNSGKSLGAGNVATEFGNANSNYFMKASAGISEDLDLGYVMEFGEFSTSALLAKYSFLNNETGPSVAGELAYGSSETTNFYYLGVIGSIAFNEAFEVFANVRFNSVNTDEGDVEIGDSVGNIEVEKEEMTYLYGAVGFNIWFNKNNGLSIYNIYIQGDGVNADPQSSVGGAFLFKF